MKIEYDREANALYITLRQKTVARTNEVGENLIIDLDHNDALVGIEVLRVRELLTPEDLARITVENLLSEPAGTSG